MGYAITELNMAKSISIKRPLTMMSAVFFFRNWFRNVKLYKSKYELKVLHF